MLTLDKDGWAQPACHFVSPHCHPRPPDEVVRLVVLHGISLPPKQFGGDDIVDLFLGQLDSNRHPAYASLVGVRVSAHFLIRRDGGLLQFVSCADCAWHAGESQWSGREQCNDFSLGIELEGSDERDYTDEQYGQLVELLGALRRQYPDIKVAGHCHIAPTRKTDPGPHFKWDWLFLQIGKEHDGR